MSDDVLTVDEAAVERFKSDWLNASAGPIERYLPSTEDARYAATLQHLVQIELEFAWKPARVSASNSTLGDPTIHRPPLVEDYLNRFPGLNTPAALMRLAEQEYHVRQRYGDKPSPEEYRRRFPGVVIGLEDLGAAPEPAATLPREPLSLEPGSMIGPYKLLQEIGKGGFGVVYLAQQEKPVRRRVALKVIKPGMDSQQVMARFEAERQALALMDHQHIARVLDAGTTDAGRPYFVMELVKGIPITEYCDQNKLTPRQRLELFIPVCQAIQHAHQKGIIHRDIKPSNVLVASQDGKAAPKVIDFGVAKAIQQRLTEKTIFTEYGQIMGTPQYMSPEQAQMNELDIDTRSDIYSLGVLLYELLTGTTPIKQEKLRRVDFDEMLRMIREEEPPKPSIRLSQSREGLTAISSERDVELKKLYTTIRGELDWIVMKALEKDRTRRYDSASAFAADIHHYLNYEPVEAGPPSATYKLRKFARKHRGVLTSAGAFAVVLVVSTFVSLSQAVAAKQQRDLAQAARQQAEQAKEEALRNFVEAEKNFHRARQTVDQFFTQVSEETLLNQPGLQPVRRNLLERALVYYEEFLRDRERAPSLREEIAATDYRVGLIREEIRTPQQALKAYELACAIQEPLLAQTPNDSKRLYVLSDTKNASGRALQKLERFDEALRAYEQAHDLRQQLVALEPDNPEFQRKLANSEMNIGLIKRLTNHSDEARRRLESAQEIRREQLSRHEDIHLRRDLGMGYYNLAVFAFQDGDGQRGEQDLQQAIKMFERVLADEPRDMANQQRLATCYRLWGDRKAATEDWEATLDGYDRARASLDNLAIRNPDVPDFQDALAGVYMNVADVQRRQRHPEQALDAVRRAGEILAQLTDHYPEVPKYQRDYAVALRILGSLQLSAGETETAAKNLEASRGLLRVLVDRFPQNPDFAAQLAETDGVLRNARSSETKSSR